MKTRLFSFLFLLIVINSCNKNDDSIKENQSDDYTIVNNEEAPTIIADGFVDVIETITEVSIEIEDESSVSTKVCYNEEGKSTLQSFPWERYSSFKNH